jgi:CheY-like chemotaxis protein
VSDVTKRILERSGYTVLAMNGKELSIYTRNRENILGLDLFMPDMQARSPRNFAMNPNLKINKRQAVPEVKRMATNRSGGLSGTAM